MMVASRVLLVEDEVLVRSVIADELREGGYEVIEAETGDEAAQLIEREWFDLLLTDVRLPGTLDGIDLAHRARSIRPQLPVLVVSGYAEQISGRLTTLRAPMAFLAKPFPMSRILASVRTLAAA
ncbi:MAG: response regulator [Chloroflexi bacterium]|nr:response regulator [Chloroflexota bacterium]